MLRVHFTSTGWGGAPGLGTFYFAPDSTTAQDVSDCLTRVHTYCEYLASLTPPAVAYVPSELVDEMNPADGQIFNTWTGSPGSPVSGTANPTAFAPPATAGNAQLLTSSFVRGRRVRGRSYVSPLASGCVDANGQFTAAKAAVLLTGLTKLKDDIPGSPPLVVWHRKNPQEDGAVYSVTSVAVPAKLAVLRSRRD